MSLPRASCRTVKRCVHHGYCYYYVLVATLLLCAGCSSFDHAWKAAEGGSTGTAPSPLVGRWIGTWRSDANDHRDQLRCLISLGSHRTLSARFHARYKKAFLRFNFSYTVPLTVRTNDGRIEFAGEADLGWYAGGVYRYEGFATVTNFYSTYNSKYDHGVFMLRRPDIGF